MADPVEMKLRKAARTGDNVTESVWCLGSKPPRNLLPPWKFVLKADPCAYCGSRGKITMDHIIPVRHGARKRVPHRGRPPYENAAPACGDCNRRKNDSTLLDFLNQGGLGERTSQTVRRPPTKGAVLRALEDGSRLTSKELGRAIGCAPYQAGECVKMLRSAGLVIRTNNRWHRPDAPPRARQRSETQSEGHGVLTDASIEQAMRTIGYPCSAIRIATQLGIHVRFLAPCLGRLAHRRKIVRKNHRWSPRMGQAVLHDGPGTES